MDFTQFKGVHTIYLGYHKQKTFGREIANFGEYFDTILLRTYTYVWAFIYQKDSTHDQTLESKNPSSNILHSQNAREGSALLLG